jgi:hypothetical protein
MPQKINIAIKKPCSENFNDFQFTGIGSYCTSCKKEVTDFRRMTDQEIQNYFKIPKKNTCGYFLESQLKTYSNTNNDKRKQNFNPFGVSMISFSLLSLLSFNSSFAQKNSKTIESYTVQKENSDTKESDSTTNTQDNIISGIVIDEHKQALPGATISLKGANITTSTDFDGKFTIHTPLDKENVFIISYIGYVTNEVKTSEKTMTISLKPYSGVLMGEVSVNRIYKSNRSFFDKLKNMFKNE